MVDSSNACTRQGGRGVGGSRRGRAAALGLVCAALAFALAAALLVGAAQRWPGPGVQDLATGLDVLAGLGAGAVSAWAGVILVSASVSLVRDALPSASSRPARAAATGLLVLASLGASTAAHAAAPTAVVTATATAETADAATTSTSAEDAPATPADELPQPGWTPTRTGPAPPRAEAPSTADVTLVTTPVTAPSERVVVHRGDTLWGIAARHLGADATDRDVAEAWPRWYAANRDVIGADPDLIRPGQQLVVPLTGGGR